jgi:hydrogenase maturation factor HypF (carbamoyltransferase family)
MKVYCPVCNTELLDAKRFHPIQPMECPHCKTHLRFTTNTDKSSPLAMFIIITMMVLHSFEILSDDAYKVFLIIGLGIGIFIVFTSKIIAVETKG